MEDQRGGEVGGVMTRRDLRESATIADGPNEASWPEARVSNIETGQITTAKPSCSETFVSAWKDLCWPSIRISDTTGTISWR